MDKMFLLSSGKSTIISEFSSLENREVYKHENNDTTDFQFFPKQLVFAELNKKDRVEILHIKGKEATTLKIQRLKKINDNAVCIACPKSYQEEVALGMRDGKIKLYNYVRSESEHQFAADAEKTCVNHLDYNASDEYLSAVFDNGLISIFGIKTKVKINTFSIDGVTTMTRFHPIKRSVLSIASHKGNVTIYDINSKRSTSHHTDVHNAPCRDLCMTESRPETLISVGFDCRVNIFDIRRKLPVATFYQDHPLSAGAMSGCGNYFCVGNLKGELLTYDIRNMKEERLLATRKVHEGQISRIAFFSTSEAKDLTVNLSNQIQNTTNENTSIAKEDLEYSSDAVTNRRDSFTDFLSPHQQSNISCLKRRDSYDFWDALGNKSNTSVCQKANRSNLLANVNNSTINSANSSPCQSFEEGLKTPRVLNPVEPVVARDRGKLRQIMEEYNAIENFNSESDKENNHTEQEIIKRLPQLVADRNSTPKQADTPRSGELSTTPTITATGVAEINARLDKLESELKFQMETNKWQTYTQMFNLWTKLNKNNETISDALEVLLQTDPFVNEFSRLKQENEMLKKELQKYSKK